MALTPQARRAIVAATVKKLAGKSDGMKLTSWSRGDSLGADAMKSGLLYYDISIGIGGLPRKRVITHHGPTGCGKTTLKWIIAAQFQRAGGVVVSSDFERKDELSWAVRCGVALEDTDEVVGLKLLKEHTIESTFDASEEFAQSLRDAGFEGPILHLWDSWQQAKSKKTFDAGQLEGGYAPETLAYSRGLGLFIPAMDNLDITLLGNSQVRANVGAMGNEKKTKVGVGYAVPHASIAIVEFKLEQKLAGDVPYQAARGTWIKNQLSDPFGTFVMPIVYGRGVDVEWSDFECARALGMVETSGAWFTVDCGDEGTFRAQGIEKTLAQLREKPNLLSGLREKARDFIGKVREVDLDAMARVSKMNSPEEAFESHEDNGGKEATTKLVKAGETVVLPDVPEEEEKPIRRRRNQEPDVEEPKKRGPGRPKKGE